MKRCLASIFRWLEDHLDPSRRLELDVLRENRSRLQTLGDNEQAEAVRLSRELEALQLEATPTALPESAPDWLPENAVALRSFLLSPTGVVLTTRGRVIQFEFAKAACADVFHTSHSAGSAEGFGKCLEWLTSLSRASRVPDASPMGAKPSETDTSPLGEAALREAMSP